MECTACGYKPFPLPKGTAEEHRICCEVLGIDPAKPRRRGKRRTRRVRTMSATDLGRLLN